LKHSRLILFFLLSSGFIFRFWLTIKYPGFLTGDDVEIIERAFSSAGIIDFHPWNIRNLFLSDILISPFLIIACKLGVTSRSILVLLVHIPFIILGTVNSLLVFKISSLIFKNIQSGLVACLIYSCHPTTILYGSSVYPRLIGTTCILGAFFLLTKSYKVKHALLAGIIMALAFTFRYSEIIFLPPVLFYAWLRWKNNKQLLICITSFAVTALITLGLYDFMTWQSPFFSIREFISYTLIQKAASSAVAAQPALFYLRTIFEWIPVFLFIFIIIGLVDKKTYSIWSMVLFPLLILSYIHHKEIRYLQAIIPFICIIGSAIAGMQIRKTGRVIYFAAVCVLCIGAIKTGNRYLQRKSVCAVEIAKQIAEDPEMKTVALPQLWAFGDLLYFPSSIKLHEINSLQAIDFDNAVKSADAIAIYSKDSDSEELISSNILDNGFEQVEFCRSGHGRNVRLFKYSDRSLHNQKSDSIMAGDTK